MPRRNRCTDGRSSASPRRRKSGSPPIRCRRSATSASTPSWWRPANCRGISRRRLRRDSVVRRAKGARSAARWQLARPATIPCPTRPAYGSRLRGRRVSAQPLEERVDLAADAAGDAAEIVGHVFTVTGARAGVLGGGADQTDLIGGLDRCAWRRFRRCGRFPPSPRPAR